ncbi:MAG: class I SAM-dependent methyltransferase [Alphaproteobacteria bacterium]
MSSVGNAATTEDNCLISHKITASLDLQVDEAKARIHAFQGTELSKEEMCSMLDQLLDHPIGKEVFMCKGLNGKNTQFLIDGALDETNTIIRWLCDKAPAVLATRERFGIFQLELQKRLDNNVHSASIPCGTMNDLLRLNIAGKSDICFTGIDLDPESLILAAQKAEEKGYQEICNFSKTDAWSLASFVNMFNLVASNGLNIYVKEDARVVELYKEFFKILKCGGTLVTSFLTPPTLVSEDAIKQRILFGTIIGVGWQNFRTEDLTRAQLTEAGFIDIEVIYDSQRMFPTVTAKKPEA